MGVQDLKESLSDIPGVTNLTVTYAPNGNQILHVGDKQIEVSPMASNEEIRAALQHPTIPTRNTKITMVSPLQGIGQKLGLLKHSAETRAKQISDRVDGLSERLDTSSTKALAALDGQEADIKDVEAFVTDIEKATNG